MKALKAVVVLVGVTGAVVLGLAASCPTEDSFGQWAREELGADSGSLTEQVKGKVLSTQAKWTAQYEHHVLWATVDAYQGSTHYRYVGVMGTWFKLEER
jgi:hypothetical protein